jgi:hypothetical protein
LTHFIPKLIFKIIIFSNKNPARKITLVIKLRFSDFSKTQLNVLFFILNFSLIFIYFNGVFPFVDLIIHLPDSQFSLIGIFAGIFWGRP